MKQLIVLGIRGVPAQHGGFETFAEYLCKYLEGSWQIIVYCQEDGQGAIYESEWGKVKRIHIPVKQTGPLGTIIFDLRSIIHSLRFNGIFLTLGYNTAIFNILHRLWRKVNVINMDGIEWKRQKWGKLAKAWFWLNERFGCWFGNHLIADHPRIEDHLATRVSQGKITMIPYGGLEVSGAERGHLEPFGLSPGSFSVVIARAEPENSLLEIVEGFSRQPRNHKLVVLGNYADDNAYHQSVKAAASDEVLFPGAIYDIEVVSALRFFASFYIHGHQVGGTNPSLVEALGAGNAVIAHDNPFNRWVAKDGAVYCAGSDGFDQVFSASLGDEALIERLKQNSRKNFIDNFQWNSILSQYEQLLLKYYPNRV